MGAGFRYPPACVQVREYDRQVPLSKPWSSTLNDGSRLSRFRFFFLGGGGGVREFGREGAWLGG